MVCIIQYTVDGLYYTIYCRWFVSYNILSMVCIIQYTVDGLYHTIYCTVISFISYNKVRKLCMKVLVPSRKCWTGDVGRDKLSENEIRL